MRSLFLSRDRFGEKPLHYRLVDGKLIFASEIKAILAHSIPRRANRGAIADYLYRAEANGRLDSFFQDVVMLPPAHNAMFDLEARSLTVHKYYEPRRGNRRVAPDEFRATLRKSVERRLVSDVPISISLSGGTDSTSVAALTSQLTGTAIKAFTTISEHGVGDETAIIAHFLEKYPQFELERSNLSEASFCGNYRAIIFHMDEPFARQSAYVRWEIANLTARHRRKVLLNGEGADEVLGGYVAFAGPFLRYLKREGKLFRLGRELVASLGHPERERIFGGLRELSATEADERQGAQALRDKFGIRVDYQERMSREYDDIKDFLHAWVHESSLPRLLVCNDKMAMANSVEGRAPFLDHEFVDLAFSMDPGDLLVNGYRKYPLRGAMRGLVPEEILFRKAKDAFHAPIFEYLKSEPIRLRIEDVFREPRTAAVFDPRAYLNEYATFRAGRRADRPFLLHALFLEEWARMFNVDFT
jgi:asparagine synthase (glutamine-hydrolysing)